MRTPDPLTLRVTLLLATLLFLWGCAEGRGPQLQSESTLRMQMALAYPQTDVLPQEQPGLPDQDFANPVPSNDQRQAAAQEVLQLLHHNIARGQLNYRFNPSGESVVLGTTGLAFIASGSNIASGPYQRSLQAIFNRLKGIMDQRQFSLQPVWGCGQALIFLAELHRTAPANSRGPIQALMGEYARKLVNSQTDRGGWCHTFEDVPNSLGYRDLVATSVLALKGLGMAAREGLAVDGQVIQRAVQYIEQSSGNGRIGYSPRANQRGMQGPGRTAGGLLALMACGQHDHPLVAPTSRYLRNTFSEGGLGSNPTHTLQGGHASAQMGLGWAAWWAGRNGHYQEFWEGQGATIMARRQADGSFHPAPSDGRNPGQAESGDYANAWHALILLGDSPYLQIDHFSTGALVLLESLRVAGDLVAAWPGSAPESLASLAALGADSAMPDPRDIIAGISAVERDLRTGFQPELVELVMRLFSLRVELSAQLDGRGTSIAVSAVLPRTAADRLGQVAVQISDPAAEARFRPVSRTLRPSARQDSTIVLNLRIPRGSTPPTELIADLQWTVLGVEHQEQLRISVTPAQ